MVNRTKSWMSQIKYGKNDMGRKNCNSYETHMTCEEIPYVVLGEAWPSIWNKRLYFSSFKNYFS